MGGMDMNALLKQAQQMQSEMMAAQENLKNEEVEASSGGGMVKVTISGDMVIKDITIDPDAVDPEDAEMLSDMVLAAVNEAIRSAQELAASKMPKCRAACPASVDERRRSRTAQSSHRRALRAARHRTPHGPAPGVSHPALQ